MDYESRIALAVEVPFLIGIGVLVARTFSSPERPAWVAITIRSIEVLAFAVLLVGAGLGYFEGLSTYFEIPPQTSRQVGAACVFAMLFVPLIGKHVRSQLEGRK